jgi:hypothetical protein
MMHRKAKQLFRFAKHPETNVITVEISNMRTMAFLEAIGILAVYLEEYVKTQAPDCPCSDCEQAKQLLAVIPNSIRRKQLK